METNDNDARWELLQVSIKDGSFIVLDKLAKKRRIYHVPYLLHAELMQQVVYIFTSNSKIMQLNLLTAARHFISSTQFKYSMQLQKIQKSFNTKQVAKAKDKKPGSPFIDIEDLTRCGFLNTVNPS